MTRVGKFSPRMVISLPGKACEGVSVETARWASTMKSSGVTAPPWVPTVIEMRAERAPAGMRTSTRSSLAETTCMGVPPISARIKRAEVPKLLPRMVTVSPMGPACGVKLAMKGVDCTMKGARDRPEAPGVRTSNCALGATATRTRSSVEVAATTCCCTLPRNTWLSLARDANPCPRNTTSVPAPPLVGVKESTRSGASTWNSPYSCATPFTSTRSAPVRASFGTVAMIWSGTTERRMSG